jgi:hypothetical protein
LLKRGNNRKSPLKSEARKLTVVKAKVSPIRQCVFAFPKAMVEGIGFLTKRALCGDILPVTVVARRKESKRIIRPKVTLFAMH